LVTDAIEFQAMTFEEKAFLFGYFFLESFNLRRLKFCNFGTFQTNEMVMVALDINEFKGLVALAEILFHQHAGLHHETQGPINGGLGNPFLGMESHDQIIRGKMALAGKNPLTNGSSLIGELEIFSLQEKNEILNQALNIRGG
jgi:hypothetical protein